MNTKVKTLLEVIKVVTPIVIDAVIEAKGKGGKKK